MNLSDCIESSGDSSHLEVFELDCAVGSIRGKGKGVNEDRFLFVAPGLGLAERAAVGYVFAVADGVSSGGRGMQAAQAAVDVLRGVINDGRSEVPARRQLVLELAVMEANRTVYEEFAGRGGSTTLTTAWLWEDCEEECMRLLWAHVGDSRIYIRKAGTWEQRTQDDARGSLLTRSIGTRQDKFRMQQGGAVLTNNDRLVLMSDGAWRCVNLEDQPTSPGAPSARDTVLWILGRARAAGPPDDATAIAINITGQGG